MSKSGRKHDGMILTALIAQATILFGIAAVTTFLMVTNKIDTNTTVPQEETTATRKIDQSPSKEIKMTIGERKRKQTAILIENAMAAGHDRLESKRAEEESQDQQNVEDANNAEQDSAEGSARQYATDDYSDTIMIGDSIMVITTTSLQETLPNVTIDASSGRSLHIGGPNEGEQQGDGVIEHVYEHARSYGRYVIGTGNNDPYGMGIDEGVEIVETIGDEAQIYFVTEYVSNNPTGTNTTNDTIRYLLDAYDNVYMIDWNGLVTQHEDEYLGNDNCHPQNSEATNAYASLVREALEANSNV